MWRVWECDEYVLRTNVGDTGVQGQTFLIFTRMIESRLSQEMTQDSGCSKAVNQHNGGY